jgi:hypothetical protein
LEEAEAGATGEALREAMTNMAAAEGMAAVAATTTGGTAGLRPVEMAIPGTLT